MLADAAARRGESVGVYAPTMSMAKELGRLFAADVAAPSKVAKATVFAVEYERGGRVAFNWSTAKHFRLFTFDAAFGDEWASLPPDMQHEGSPGALLRGRVRSAANPRVVVSASPSASGLRGLVSVVVAVSSITTSTTQPPSTRYWPMPNRPRPTSRRPNAEQSARRCD